MLKNTPIFIVLLLGVSFFVYVAYSQQVKNEISKKVEKLEGEKINLEQVVDSLENKNRVSGTKINDLTTTVETAMLYAKAQDTFFDLQRFGLATTTRYGATNQMELLTNLVNAVTLTNDTRLKSMIDDLNSSRQKANDASIGFMLYTPSKIVDILSQPGQLSSSTN